jgi:hypothetical protein
MSGRPQVKQVDPGEVLDRERTLKLVKMHQAAFERIGVTAATTSARAGGETRSGGSSTTSGRGKQAGARAAGAARQAGAASPPARSDEQVAVDELLEAATDLATHPVVGPQAAELAARAAELSRPGAPPDRAGVAELADQMHTIAVRAAQDALVIEALADTIDQGKGVIVAKRVSTGPDGSTRVVLSAGTTGEFDLDVAPAAGSRRKVTIHTARAGIHEQRGCDEEEKIANGILDTIDRNASRRPGRKPGERSKPAAAEKLKELEG